MTDTVNPPAFPAQIVDCSCDDIGKKEGVWHYPGMTLLDYMAANTKQGFAADPIIIQIPKEEIARTAYEWADAMLKERTKWIK